MCFVVFEILPAKSDTTFNNTQAPPTNSAQNSTTCGAASTGSQSNQMPMDTHLRPLDTQTQGTMPQDTTYTDQHTRQHDGEPPNQYRHLSAAGGVNTAATFNRGPAGGIPVGRGQHNNMVNPGGQHTGTHGGQYSQYPNITTANTFIANRGGYGARFPIPDSRRDANITRTTDPAYRPPFQPPNTEASQMYGDQHMPHTGGGRPTVHGPRGTYVCMCVFGQ